MTFIFVCLFVHLFVILIQMSLLINVWFSLCRYFPCTNRLTQSSVFQQVLVFLAPSSIPNLLLVQLIDFDKPFFVFENFTDFRLISDIAHSTVVRATSSSTYSADPLGRPQRRGLVCQVLLNGLCEIFQFLQFLVKFQLSNSRKMASGELRRFREISVFHDFLELPAFFRIFKILFFSQFFDSPGAFQRISVRYEWIKKSSFFDVLKEGFQTLIIPKTGTYSFEVIGPGTYFKDHKLC